MEKADPPPVAEANASSEMGIRYDGDGIDERWG
jgi:hypothetical protein